MCIYEWNNWKKCCMWNVLTFFAQCTSFCVPESLLKQTTPYSLFWPRTFAWDLQVKSDLTLSVYPWCSAFHQCFTSLHVIFFWCFQVCRDVVSITTIIYHLQGVKLRKWRQLSVCVLSPDSLIVTSLIQRNTAPNSESWNHLYYLWLKASRHSLSWDFVASQGKRECSG